jgi:hypothetical protein
MGLYNKLKESGYSDGEANRISIQMVNRFGERFVELVPVEILLDPEQEEVVHFVSGSREEGKNIHWFETKEERYFNGSVRVPYLVLIYDVNNLRGDSSSSNMSSK